MAYNYQISFGGVTDYIPYGLVDSGAKVIWDKSDNGLMYRKSLSGSLILNRSNNEQLFDGIADGLHCNIWYISVLDHDGALVVKSMFTIRDIQYNMDKCSMTIKPRYYDPNNVDAIIEKDFNIINDNLNIYSISYNENYQFEYQTCYADGVQFSDLTYDDVNFVWLGAGLIPSLKASCIAGGYTTENQMADGWTYFSQQNTWGGISNFFNVVTKWFREVKLTHTAIDPNHSNPPPSGGSFEFSFVEVTVKNGVNYNKWVRNVSNLSGRQAVNNTSQIHWDLIDYYGNSELRTLTRARKLNDILLHFSDELNCTLSSQFFFNNSNPVSGADLTNIMIEQKSDAIFVSGVESTDPATLGIITMKQLMEQLWAMFQVTWVIENGVFYVEHINYFRNNFDYTVNTTVGIDLPVYYPICLAGTYQYEYDGDIPIREKFSFMEAWNLDFVGSDIEYTNCITEGKTDSFDAGLVTTDIDPTYLDNEASKDGFVFFHCDQDNFVISEVGILSGISSANAHFSYANLHENYWKYNRSLDSGIMNGVQTSFQILPKKLKMQKPIEFPFCVENFDDEVNNLVRTTMGDGEIVKAEYSFKSGTIKIELSYE